MPVVPGLTDLEVFARGGYATVYRATQISVGREVAVKIENRTLDNERDQQRFMREARAAGRMSSHPHVVDLFDVGMTADGHPYLIMEMCHGSYADRMHHSPLGAAEARDVGVKIADALADAHHLGVLHRDVKPANILYSRFNEPALADFGLAVLAEARDAGVTLEVLTPAYAPPEMFKHEPPSPAVDVYALCATLYAVMHGRPPRWRPGLNPSLISLMELFNEPIPDLPGIPTALLDVLRQGMANDPRQRPTAERLRDMLAALSLGPPHHAAPARPYHPALPSHTPNRPPAPEPGTPGYPASLGPLFPASSGHSAAPHAPDVRPRPAVGSGAAIAAALGGPHPAGIRTPGDDHPTVPTAAASRRPGRRLIGLGLAVLLGFLAGGIWYLTQRGTSDPPPDRTAHSSAPVETGASARAIAVLPGCQSSGEVRLPDGARCPAELECFGAMRVRGTTAQAERVPCVGRHTWEAYAEGDLPADVDGTDHEAVKADPVVRQVCSQNTFRSTTSRAVATGWHFEVLPPPAEALAGGDRIFRCLAGRGANQLLHPVLAE